MNLFWIIPVCLAVGGLAGYIWGLGSDCDYSKDEAEFGKVTPSFPLGGWADYAEEYKKAALVQDDYFKCKETQ